MDTTMEATFSLEAVAEHALGAQYLATRMLCDHRPCDHPGVIQAFVSPRDPLEDAMSVFRATIRVQ